MSDNSAIDLASMMCSRLCHDLLSPVGALNNGLELLADETDPEMRKRCFELLEQSAVTSANKLKFFRLAFGAASGYGEMVEVGEPRAAIEALIGENKRIEANWSLRDNKLPKDAVKILLNFANFAIEALIRGGKLDIGVETRDKICEIVVRASGSNIAFDKTIGQALEGELPYAELSGRTAPAHMLHLLAQKNGGGLQYQSSNETLVLGGYVPLAEDLIG